MSCRLCIRTALKITSFEMYSLWNKEGNTYNETLLILCACADAQIIRCLT